MLRVFSLFGSFTLVIASFFPFYFLLLTLLIVLLINEVTDVSVDPYTPSPFSLTHSLTGPISCALSVIYFLIPWIFLHFKIHPPRSTSIFLSYLHLICIAFYLSWCPTNVCTRIQVLFFFSFLFCYSWSLALLPTPEPGVSFNLRIILPIVVMGGG